MTSMYDPNADRSHFPMMNITLGVETFWVNVTDPQAMADIEHHGLPLINMPGTWEELYALIPWWYNYIVVPSLFVAMIICGLVLGKREKDETICPFPGNFYGTLIDINCKCCMECCEACDKCVGDTASTYYNGVLLKHSTCPKGCKWPCLKNPEEMERDANGAATGGPTLM